MEIRNVSFAQNASFKRIPSLKPQNITVEYTDKTGYLNVTSYVWKWGENSITRHDNGIYRFDSAIEFIKYGYKSN